MEPEQCIAWKRDKCRCSRTTAEGQHYCYQHKTQSLEDLTARITKPEYFHGWLKNFRTHHVEELETALKAGVVVIQPSLLETMNERQNESYAPFYNWYCGFYAKSCHPARYMFLYCATISAAIRLTRFQIDAGAPTTIVKELGGLLEALKYNNNHNANFLGLLTWHLSISPIKKKDEILQQILSTGIVDGLLFTEQELLRKYITETVMRTLRERYSEQQQYVVDLYKKRIDELLNPIFFPLLEARKQTFKKTVKERQGIFKGDLIAETHEPVREWIWVLAEEDKKEMADELGITRQEYERLLLETSALPLSVLVQ